MLSAYYNQLCTIKDTKYIPEDPKLPPLAVSTQDQSHNIARRPTESDLLENNILLIYDKAKMAVQCLTAQELIIDNQPFLCTNISLQWQREPQTIKDAKTEKIILGHRQYKSAALHWTLKQEF